MKVTVFGSGYIELVTEACLAEAANEEFCVDINPQLNLGELPAYEPRFNIQGGGDIDIRAVSTSKYYNKGCIKPDRHVVMNIYSVEPIQYTRNTMLTTQISLMNERSNLVEPLGTDIEQAPLGIDSTLRIGYHATHSGSYYNVSCFTKDERRLHRAANERDYATPLLLTHNTIKNRQENILFGEISPHFANDLKGKALAIWESALNPKVIRCTQHRATF